MGAAVGNARVRVAQPGNSANLRRARGNVSDYNLFEYHILLQNGTPVGVLRVVSYGKYHWVAIGLGLKQYTVS